jgi:hypothetical protein
LIGFFLLKNCIQILLKINMLSFWVLVPSGYLLTPP